MNASEAARALAGQIEALCADLLPNGVRVGPEWLVGSIAGEPGQSLAVRLVGARRGLWLDRANVDDAGDALDLVAAVRFRGNRRAALRWVRSWLGAAHTMPAHSRAARYTGPGHERRWSDRAEATWAACKPITGTLAATYLAHRHCALPTSGECRFHSDLEHWPTRTRWPAIVSRITDFVTGEPMSLHLTFLARDGRGKAPIDKPKLLLAGHAKAGGVIRLFADAEVTVALGVSEGIETGLSVVAAGWSPVWAAIDAGNLGRLPAVAGIESLTVFADTDKAGQRAAYALAARWHTAGRQVRIATAPEHQP